MSSRLSRPVLGAMLAAAITALLIAAGEYHDAHLAEQTRAHGGALVSVDPNFLSPFIHLAYALSAPAVLPAAAIGKLFGGIVIRHYFIDTRYIAFAVLAAIWWYLLLKNLHTGRKRGNKRLLSLPIRIVVGVALVTLGIAGFFLARLTPIVGLGFSIWAWVLLAYLLRRELHHLRSAES